MQAFEDVVAVLGLSGDDAMAASPFGLMASIEKGLPVAALDRMARDVAPGA
ncbi:hypothetical protein [Consotaella salsifontis]|uniref:Uncharacterized protein n=1 Tax=Consotaella salsifontis TaxID=1365950 RepID=A0A1T4SUB3_9HYPH|nr:hypothetical protein [Consotaella salsifontis]SKA31746.1 hypothetical protein SAMN05428963_11452 [Consotaella salsifontis]